MARRMALAVVTLAGAAALVMLWSDGAGAATPPAPPLASVQVAGLPPLAVADPLPTADTVPAPGTAPAVSPATDVPLGALGSVTVTPPAPLAPAVQPVADTLAALTAPTPPPGSSPGHPLAPVADALRSLFTGLSGVVDPAGLTSVILPFGSDVREVLGSAPAGPVPDLAFAVGLAPLADAAAATRSVSLDLATGVTRALADGPVGAAGGAVSGAIGSAGSSGGAPYAAVVSLFAFAIAAVWRRLRPAAGTALAPAFLLGSARPG